MEKHLIATQSREQKLSEPLPERPLASLNSVYKRFGKIEALRGINIAIFPGELVTLLGPNGSGKTTSIDLLLGLKRPDKGKVLLFDRDPHLLEARAQIGVTPQVADLPPTLKVKEIIALVQAHYPDPVALASLVERFDLGDIVHRQAGGLSGGQKRKVSLALAFVGKPRIVFLDEPTVGLDVEIRRGLWQEIRNYMQGGGTVLLTTHYLEEAEALASRVIIIYNGQVISEGSVQTIKAQFGLKQVRFSAAVLPDLPDVAYVRQEHGTYTLYTLDVDSVVRSLVLRDVDFTDLEIVSTSLEDAFLQITGVSE